MEYWWYITLFIIIWGIWVWILMLHTDSFSSTFILSIMATASFSIIIFSSSFAGDNLNQFSESLDNSAGKALSYFVVIISISVLFAYAYFDEYPYARWGVICYFAFLAFLAGMAQDNKIANYSDYKSINKEQARVNRDEKIAMQRSYQRKVKQLSDRFLELRKTQYGNTTLGRYYAEGRCENPPVDMEGVCSLMRSIPMDIERAQNAADRSLIEANKGYVSDMKKFKTDRPYAPTKVAIFIFLLEIVAFIIFIPVAERIPDIKLGGGKKGK